MWILVSLFRKFGLRKRIKRGWAHETANLKLCTLETVLYNCFASRCAATTSYDETLQCWRVISSRGIMFLLNQLGTDPIKWIRQLTTTNTICRNLIPYHNNRYFYTDRFPRVFMNPILTDEELLSRDTSLQEQHLWSHTHNRHSGAVGFCSYMVQIRLSFKVHKIYFILSFVVCRFVGNKMSFTNV